MRLRPGGRSAPLVTPIDGAISYYENLGRDLGACRSVACAAGRRRPRDRTATACRAESLRISQLPGFRHAAPVARDEASDRGGTEIARDDRAQHQARTRRNPRARIHRAGAHADLRRTRSAASNRADRRRARRSSTISATCRRSARANSPMRTCSCATSSTSCKSSPACRPTSCPPTRTGCAQLAARMGFGKGRDGAEEIQRPTEISSRTGRAAISRDARRRRRRVDPLGLVVARNWRGTRRSIPIPRPAICASSALRAPKKAHGISNCSRADPRMPRPARGVASCSNASARC